jgi:hypothetical protein
MKQGENRGGGEMMLSVTSLCYLALLTSKSS